MTTLDMTSVLDLDKQSTTGLALDRRHWITLLVDRSSSMEELRDATVAGLNVFIREHAQRANTRLRVVEFGTDDNNKLQLTLMFTNEWTAASSESRALRRLDYRPRGGTPLLAAVMQTIANMEPQVEPRDAALVVIQTDGEDNASPGVTLDMVRRRIAAKQAEGNWTFAYLGAELDAWQTADGMHVGALNALSYAPTPEGVRAAYATTTEAATRWLKGRPSSALGGSGFFPLQLPPPRQ